MADNIIHQQLEGSLKPQDFDELTRQLLRLQSRSKANRLCCDLTRLNEANISLLTQTPDIQAIFRLNQLKRIAFFCKDKTVTNITRFVSETTGLEKYGFFRTKRQAVDWLKSKTEQA